MNFKTAIASIGSRQWPRRSIPWAGGLFIAAIAALAAYDIARSYQATVSDTGRELETQARVIAEQTARTLQTIDRVLRHIAEQYRDTALSTRNAQELSAYLEQQAVGLPQVDGLAIIDAAGIGRAATFVVPGSIQPPDLSGTTWFRALRDDKRIGMYVDGALRSQFDGQWIFPIARRLETRSGAFAGVVVARGRIDYFQQFYRDVRLDRGTKVTLMHQNGTLLARHPVVESALGKHFPLYEQMRASRASGETGPTRTISPVDGVERFGAVLSVPDYPLGVIVTRDASAALAPWRAQSIGTAIRTLGLGVLAALLLALLLRQLARLEAARAALYESKERFTLAAAGSDDGIWDWDVAGDRVFASMRAREIFGLAPGPEVTSRDEWFASIAFHPDDAQRRAAAMDAHMAGKSPAYAGEFRVRHQDGSYRWIRIRGLCVRDAAGEPLRMAGSVTDIDAHKRAEDALRESEERYALAMTGSDEGHWVWDLARDELYASARLNEILGMPADQRLTCDSAYFARIPMHPDDRERVRKAKDDHLAGISARLVIEYRIVDPGTGEVRWISTRAQCFRDAEGKPIRLAGSTVDVTDRKRTEERLRQSEERFTLAVAGSNDGILDWDLINDRMYTSERALRICGVESEVTMRSRAEWMALLRIHPDDLQRTAEDLRHYLAGASDVRDGEYRLQHPDGQYRWVRVRMLCVRDAHGKLVRLAGSVSDIDANKRVEAALRESEERYALAMTGSNEGHWVWDLTTDEMYASARLNELFGIPPTAQLVPYAAYFARIPIHADDRPRVRKSWDEHLAGASSRLEVEYRIVDHATGEIRWIQSRGQCFRDEQGKPVRVAGSTVDITKRKYTEEQLRQSEERFALAVAGSNDGILDWDIVNDRMFASERAMRILGIECEPSIRTRREWVALVTPRFHPDDLQRKSVDLRQHAESGSDVHEGEYRVRNLDGEYRWTRFRGMQIRDAAGSPIRWSGSVSDIDAEKRTEEALRRSEERYQLAVAGSNEGLWDWDLTSDSLFLSARAQELMGLEPSEPQMPRREWIARTVYHPDDIADVRNAMSAHLKNANTRFNVEYRLLHPSGEAHWYLQRGLALRDDSGRPYRMAGSMEDITDRKNAEVARDRLEGQLRQAQKLEAIGTLAGGIAHDFNNILAAILGYGEMAQKDAAEGTRLRRHIDAAISAGMRAKSLVERILAFSRSDMGERVPVHVQSVVSEALDLVAASLPPGVTLERDLAAGDAAVLGDPTQVHQVVMNLCANAVQAMKSKGTLTVTLDLMGMGGSRCATSVLSDANHVRLRVRDTGTGIAPQVLERIFDPFFTTKEIGVGTGLGLSLVHGIVTDLGGGIEIDSRVGEGSTFTVYLPWQSCVAAPASIEEIVPPNGNGEIILLVDDEEPLVRLGEEMIAALGYEPVGFTSSAAALQTFRAEPQRFNAVLSDEAMPEMTGSELVTEIRKIRADIPIVLMSGYVTPALSTRARDAGVAEVLSKPLVARDIARSLAGALGH